MQRLQFDGDVDSGQTSDEGRAEFHCPSEDTDTKTLLTQDGERRIVESKHRNFIVSCVRESSLSETKIAEDDTEEQTGTDNVPSPESTQCSVQSSCASGLTPRPSVIDADLGSYQDSDVSVKSSDSGGAKVPMKTRDLNEKLLKLTGVTSSFNSSNTNLAAPDGDDAASSQITTPVVEIQSQPVGDVQAPATGDQFQSDTAVQQSGNVSLSQEAKFSNTHTMQSQPPGSIQGQQQHTQVPALSQAQSGNQTQQVSTPQQSFEIPTSSAGNMPSHFAPYINPPMMQYGGQQQQMAQQLLLQQQMPPYHNMMFPTFYAADPVQMYHNQLLQYALLQQMQQGQQHQLPPQMVVPGNWMFPGQMQQMSMSSQLHQTAGQENIAMQADSASPTQLHKMRDHVGQITPVTFTDSIAFSDGHALKKDMTTSSLGSIAGLEQELKKLHGRKERSMTTGSIITPESGQAYHVNPNEQHNYHSLPSGSHIPLDDGGHHGRLYQTHLSHIATEPILYLDHDKPVKDLVDSSQDKIADAEVQNEQPVEVKRKSRFSVSRVTDDPLLDVKAEIEQVPGDSKVDDESKSEEQLAESCPSATAADTDSVDSVPSQKNTALNRQTSKQGRFVITRVAEAKNEPPSSETETILAPPLSPPVCDSEVDMPDGDGAINSDEASLKTVSFYVSSPHSSSDSLNSVTSDDCLPTIVSHDKHLHRDNNILLKHDIQNISSLPSLYSSPETSIGITQLTYSRNSNKHYVHETYPPAKRIENRLFQSNSNSSVTEHSKSANRLLWDANQKSSLKDIFRGMQVCFYKNRLLNIFLFDLI